MKKNRKNIFNYLFKSSAPSHNQTKELAAIGINAIVTQRLHLLIVFVRAVTIFKSILIKSILNSYKSIKGDF